MMQPDFVKDSLLLEIGWAAAMLAMSIVLAWIVVKIVRFFQHRLEHHRRKTDLAPQLVQSIARPLLFFIVTDGLLMALGSLSCMQQWTEILGQIGKIVLIAGITYALANILGSLLTWYMRSLRARRKARLDEGLIRFVRRVLIILVFMIGVLIILDFLDIQISPIIAGLGLGGLAVALALQPTLANFFASTQIISDRVVRVGDYIELENTAIRGYVTDVGWRSTRIRTPFNNMIIVPNSRLADSVITNYYGPTMEMGVVIDCGVSYNANLPKVEKISLEVAGEVVQELDEADKTFEPWFAYEEFGDSNINFWIWVRAKDRISSFRVKSEIIKRLKARLDKDGIVINYPARLLTFEDSEVPPYFLTGEKETEGK
ncbi:MAG: mechanosensitive ion channel family protein [Dehalococcoidales bacterium]|nr:MAG: mechanosensitive ion channel family protein [Dehalococcoidales bacterium]